MRSSRCFLPNTKKNTLPSGVWAHHGAAYMGHRGRAGGLEVWVCQLMWATSICRHMPRGRGPRILRTADAGRCWCPLEAVLSRGGQAGARHEWQRGGLARLLSAGQSLHACVLSHLLDSFLFLLVPFQLDLGEGLPLISKTSNPPPVLAASYLCQLSTSSTSEQHNS